MSHFCPHYPPPTAKRPPWWRLYLGKRRSWLDSLYERSYVMKMGELHLPGIDLYMVNEPALVRRVMVDEASAFPKHDMLGEALRPLLGDSIFTTNGPRWQRQRTLMEPSFAAARVQHVFAHMQGAADALVQRLRQRPAGSALDAQIEMTHVAADIILRTIVSQPLDGATALKVFQAFERYQALAPRLLMPAFFGLRWLRPWWQLRRSRQAADDIRSLLIDLLRPRYEASRQGMTDTSDDLLASLLGVRDERSGQGFGFDELVDQVAMLFLAGHETSASALAWALHLLAHAPDIQQRLHDEARPRLAALRSDPSVLKDLPLARNVFREALRLFPPVGFLARQSAHACQLRDKSVPEGGSVVVSPWLLHRHRHWWPEPDAFDPDRFDTEAPAPGEDGLSSREALPRAYLPFGMGPRVCIGAAFAQQEATLILATLAAHFRFEPVPGHVPEPVGRLTIRAENGIRLQVFARDEAP
jgi:cytochrome P450